MYVMSFEKLLFILLVVFIIGFKDDLEFLMKYGKFMLFYDKLGNYVVEFVKGIVEGEIWVLVVGMMMEDIFCGIK